MIYKCIEHDFNKNGKTYIMSDIHGDYTKFLKMLKKINFSNNDVLYILGDIMDRGKQPFNILGYIIKHKNIHLILGNHEVFLIDYYEENEKWEWLQNGGSKTFTQFMYKDYIQQEFLYNFIKNLPSCIILDNKYILSHAGLYIPPLCDNLSINSLIHLLGDKFLYHRQTIGKEKQYKHYTQICGHNTIQSILNSENKKDVKILKRTGIIYIDCGCGFKNFNSKLACLCINDMSEYYID